MIKAIVAIDTYNGISKQGEIPWHYKADMKYFSNMTNNSICIMGRYTYEYILNKSKGKGLPNRKVYVVSRNKKLKYETAKTFTSVLGALAAAVQTDENIWICGGSGIYQEALPYCEKVVITQIPVHADCDNFFPVSYVKNTCHLSGVEDIEQGLRVYKFTNDTPKSI